jgi:hypothetical protein
MVSLTPRVMRPHLKPASRCAARRRCLRIAELSDRGLRPEAVKQLSSPTCTKRLADRGNAVSSATTAFRCTSRRHHAGERRPFRDATRSARQRADGFRDDGRRTASSVPARVSDVCRHAQVRAYGNPGLRRTRWIVGRAQPDALDEIRAGCATCCRRSMCMVGACTT